MFTLVTNDHDQYRFLNSLRIGWLSHNCVFKKPPKIKVTMSKKVDKLIAIDTKPTWKPH